MMAVGKASDSSYKLYYIILALNLCNVDTPNPPSIQLTIGS